jgi:hypothetical protein
VPTNVVHSSRDEAKWSRAKAQAEKQGKGENYAYIMSIYKNMGPSHDFEEKKAMTNFELGYNTTMKLAFDITDPFGSREKRKRDAATGAAMFGALGAGMMPDTDGFNTRGAAGAFGGGALGGLAGMGVGGGLGALSGLALGGGRGRAAGELAALLGTGGAGIGGLGGALGGSALGAYHMTE